MIVVDSPNVQQANENVVDTADMLTFEQQEALSAHLRELRDRDDVVVVVETVNTITENVEYYARKRAQELGVGDDAKDNGLYILLVRSPRRVQVQAGNGISTYLGGDDITRVVSESIVPRLKAGDMVGGLTTGADALVETYLDNRATNRVRSDSRASGGVTSGSRTGRRFSGERWRSAYSSSSGGDRERSSSAWRYVPFVILVIVLIWMLATNGFRLSGSSGGGGGGGYDSGYDSGGGWDSGGGYDSGGGGSWDSGGGSDYGGGDFDSGSGGGSDW
jgi:uncharacterized protein